MAKTVKCPKAEADLMKWHYISVPHSRYCDNGKIRVTVLCEGRTFTETRDCPTCKGTGRVKVTRKGKRK